MFFISTHMAFSCGILVFSFMCVRVCVQACTCFQFWSLFLLKSSLFLLKSYIVEIIGENMKRMIALPRERVLKGGLFPLYSVFFFWVFQ